MSRAQSLAIALLCTVWMAIGPAAGLVGWAGFAGCTAYFTSPRKGADGLPMLFASVGSGSLFAFISLLLGSLAGSGVLGYAVGLGMTCVTTYLMCADARFDILGFISGAFIGSFSTFAAGGSPMVVPSLAVGILLGLACDKAGQAAARMAEDRKVQSR